MNIGVIGTAGRGEDGDRLNRSDFFRMSSILRDIIKSLAPDTDEKINLVSGGAAWADHLAVTYYIYSPWINELHLELPCKILSDGTFIDTGEYDFRVNPGRTSNLYHRRFSEKLEYNSQTDFITCLSRDSCKISIENGFFERNSKIAAKADHCVAFTFGNGNVLADGGTADTMKKFLKKGTGKSFHIDLNDFSIYSPAVIK